MPDMHPYDRELQKLSDCTDRLLNALTKLTFNSRWIPEDGMEPEPTELEQIEASMLHCFRRAQELQDAERQEFLGHVADELAKRGGHQCGQCDRLVNLIRGHNGNAATAAIRLTEHGGKALYGVDMTLMDIGLCRGVGDTLPDAVTDLLHRIREQQRYDREMQAVAFADADPDDPVDRSMG